MTRKRHKLASMERLESRRVLSANSGVLQTPEINAALVTIYSDSHVRVRDSSGGYFISTERNSSDGESIPFASGDFNGDLVTDLLALDSAGDWWLHLNDGTQLYQAPAGTGLADVQHLGVADFDNDSTLDVLSMDDAGQLWLSRNQLGSFVHEKAGEFAHKTGWSQIYIDDFSGDGLPDVLGGDVGGHWWLAKNTGNGTFNNYLWGRFPDFNWVDVLHGQFTADQYADVLARAPDNTWWLWEGTESGFELAKYFGHWKMRDNWTDVAVGDFNADQINDVIGRAEDGTLWVGSASSDGFHTWQWGSGWIDSADWKQVTIMDINGDGLDDQVGRANSDTWWYAINVGNRFQNHYWNAGGEADFVLQNFRVDGGVDIVDSLPAGGDDPRTVNASQSGDTSRDSLGPLSNRYGINASNNRDYFRSMLRNASTESKDTETPATEEEGNQTNALFNRATPAQQSLWQQEVANGSFEIVDEKLVIHGPFTGVGGFEIKSKGGFLSLETINIPSRGEVKLADPFPPATGVIIRDRSDHIVIGTLVSVDLADETVTSVRYSGPAELANDDLDIDIGLGVTPFRLPIAD